MRRAVLLIVLFAPLAAPQPAPDPLLAWMNRLARKQLDEREREIASIHTPADAARRREAVRRKLLDILGGIPAYDGPLRPRELGRLANERYTLEKVIFESLPSYYVTANVYRPNRPGRYPAVLLSAGHTTLGKTENHRIAANLAAKGFVALAYDPVGLGERMQAYDRRVGRGIAGCCANEHLQAGAQSLLIGQSVARYFIKDAMRALDYLVSRPDVDPNRIGAAGCSGGGCLTTYIAAFDPRIKAAAPACFLNSLRVLFTGPYPDSEMSLPRFLASGLDHADFLEVSGEIPWLVLATEGDFFTPAGVRPVYEEARRWFRLHGVEGKVQMLLGPGPHGTPAPVREALYAWMIRWLKPGSNPTAREEAVPLLADHELQVTASGQVEDEPGSRKLFEVIRDEYRALRRPLGVPELLAELRRLQDPADDFPKPVTRLHLPESGGRGPALLLVADRTSAALAQSAKARGAVVLEVEPRDSPAANDNRPFLGNWMTNARANSIGRNLAGMRALDIRRAVDSLAQRPDVDPARIYAAARDVKGVWLLMAAALDSRIARVWLDRTPPRLALAMDGPIHTNLFDALIPGFLLHWDLDTVAAALGSRPVLWTDPANWMGRVMPFPGAFRYRHSGQGDDEFLAELLR